MKPFELIKPVFIFLLLVLAGPDIALAKLNVVTTTQDIAAIVREVGGELVNVEAIAKGYQDPHVIEAKPSYMLKVNRADLLAYQGLELEVGWLPLLIQGGRNPDVLPGKPGHLDISQAITPLEIPTGEVDRSMGDVHPLGNPHYPLNPENGLLMARLIADRLSQLDPVNTETYANNLEHFRQHLQKKIEEWKSRLKKFRGVKLVTYHATWAYLLDYFGFEKTGTIENRPGIPPSGKHLAELTTVMQQTNTKIILQSNFYDDEFSKLLAGKTQAIIVVLPVHVGGTPEATDYFGLFDIIVGKLEQAFSKN